MHTVVRQLATRDHAQRQPSTRHRKHRTTHDSPSTARNATRRLHHRAPPSTVQQRLHVPRHQAATSWTLLRGDLKCGNPLRLRPTQERAAAAPSFKQAPIEDVCRVALRACSASLHPAARLSFRAPLRPRAPHGAESGARAKRRGERPTGPPSRRARGRSSGVPTQAPRLPPRAATPTAPGGCPERRPGVAQRRERRPRRRRPRSAGAKARKAWPAPR